MIARRWRFTPLALPLLALVGCAEAPAPGAVASHAASNPSPDEKNVTNREPSTASKKTVTEPANRTEAAARVGPILDRGFDDIKFEMEKEDPFLREMLTPEIEALVGKRIRIRGYILPSFRKRGLRQFVLVRDNMECCFGPGAALFDCVLVDMDAGKSAEFSVRPVAVEGIFDVRELIGPDGKHLAIYHLQADQVD